MCRGTNLIMTHIPNMDISHTTYNKVHKSYKDNMLQIQPQLEKTTIIIQDVNKTQY